MNIDESLKKIQILNGTALKSIAALIMVIDHIGYMFFPKVIWIRKVGRLSFPIFAFFVAEGFFNSFLNSSKFLGPSYIAKSSFDLMPEVNMYLMPLNSLLNSFFVSTALMISPAFSHG